MKISTLHYIGGDTQNGGFHKISMSPEFRSKDMLWVNNGKQIVDKARVEARNAQRNFAGGFSRLCHVWEYETGGYGIPVVVNTLVGIGSDRQHGFSEYVEANTATPASELGTPGQIIAAAEQLRLLTLEKFSMLDNREIDAEEDEWPIGETPALPPYPEKGSLDEEWKLTLLSHYWKQASIRAFSEDTPQVVRVFLGSFARDKQEDIDATIQMAQRFFADVIANGLPKQVQNIASMAAGVDCGDNASLYTALQFCIGQNLYAEETLQVKKPKELRAYRLNTAEMNFIRLASDGKVPESLATFAEQYAQMSGCDAQKVALTPFMADYRIWYALYCIEQLKKEGMDFLHSAGMDMELNASGTKVHVRLARACYLLRVHLRQLVREHEELRKYADGLLHDLEGDLFALMLGDMQEAEAQPFLTKRTELLEFHQRIVTRVPEDQLDAMIRLAVLDQQCAKNPQFVRCYPDLPLKGEEADARNARELKALLEQVVKPLIERERGKEKPENKYLLYLKEEAFANNWCKRYPATCQVMQEFWREEIQDPVLHILLYGITTAYLPRNELGCVTLRLFAAQYSKPGTLPDEGSRTYRVLLDSCKEGAGQPDSDVCAAMNEYYVTCFEYFNTALPQIRESIVDKLGGSTVQAMVEIFRQQAAEHRRMTAEEAKAVFGTLAGDHAQYAKNDAVKATYAMLLKDQCTAFLQKCESPVEWLRAMLQAAPFTLDMTDSMVGIFDASTASATQENPWRLNAAETQEIFATLGGETKGKAQNEQVCAAYIRMLKVYRDAMLKHGEIPVSWLGDMVKVAKNVGIPMDTSDDLVAVFEEATRGQRMEATAVGSVFAQLGSDAKSPEEKVRPVFEGMITAQTKTALANENDFSIVEWLRSVVHDSHDYFYTDTSNLLNMLFSESGVKAENGAARKAWIRPTEAAAAFEALAENASEIRNQVKKNYTAMLERRMEAARQEDDDGAFTWLTEMTDNVYATYTQDRDWLSERHTEMVMMLADTKTMRSEDMAQVEKWLNEESVTRAGIGILQRYCDAQLQAGNDEAAERFERYFRSVDNNCSALQSYGLKKETAVFVSELENCTAGSFGALVKKSKGELARFNVSLDEMFTMVREEVERYLNGCFENTQDIYALIEAEKTIPESSFKAAWKMKLDEKIKHQQAALFNKRQSVEKLLELRKVIVSQSQMDDSLTAAYELIDHYEEMLAELAGDSEAEAMTDTGEMLLKQIYPRLNRAETVRKTLCACLRAQPSPAVEAMKKRSFRHKVAAFVMQGALTAGQSKQGNQPDWGYVLGKMFTLAELEQATRKPYAAKNLPVLQRLLALMDTVQLMNRSMPEGDWEEMLARKLHSEPSWVGYQNALARNVKASMRYQLSFDHGKLAFNEGANNSAASNGQEES